MEQATKHRTIDTMPAHARVWVYKSAIPFTSAQREAMLERGAAFTAAWAAHGSALDACVDVLHDHFLIIAVDEQQATASGCSIDKSVRLVQQFERELGAQLTDRMVVLYEAGGAIAACRVEEVQELISSGRLTAGTPVFDDLVSTVAQLRERFPARLDNTWLARWL